MLVNDNDPCKHIAASCRFAQANTADVLDFAAQRWTPCSDVMEANKENLNMSNKQCALLRPKASQRGRKQPISQDRRGDVGQAQGYWKELADANECGTAQVIRYLPLGWRDGWQE
jgi:hypothetical protein